MESSYIISECHHLTQLTAYEDGSLSHNITEEKQTNKQSNESTKQSLRS
jgi:hypothetical protein